MVGGSGARASAGGRKTGANSEQVHTHAKDKSPAHEKKVAARHEAVTDGDGAPAEGRSDGDSTSAEGHSAASEVDNNGHQSVVGMLEEKVSELQNTLMSKQEKIDELQNECLRARADADNYRKRTERDMAKAIEFANERILRDTVTVLDNFDRALGSIQKTDENAALFDGVDLIKKEWVGMLGNNWGVREMESVRQAFDPALHEAVAIEEDPQATEQYVGEEFQKGYWLHSRVLRPAKVKVIKPSEQDKDKE